MTFQEAIRQLQESQRGTEIRDALVSALNTLNDSINVTPPKNCPNCGATVTGRSANCEYCGTLLIWKQGGNT